MEEEMHLQTEKFKHITEYFTKTNLHKLLGNVVLEACEGKNFVLINIGKGSVIKESVLIEAGNETDIGGHFGWRAQDIAAKFKENYERFLKNESLLCEVDFSKGY